jgi:hypothetical protein
MHSPNDLNDADRVRGMFEFFGLSTMHQGIVAGGRKNKSLGHKSIITPEDERECEEVLERLPGGYLEIFRCEPYATCKWRARFQPSATPVGK